MTFRVLSSVLSQNLDGSTSSSNNAGATWGAPTEDPPIEASDEVMNLNVRPLFLLSQQTGKRSNPEPIRLDYELGSDRWEQTS